VLSLALGGFGIYQFGKSQGMAGLPAPESRAAAPAVGGAPAGTTPERRWKGKKPPDATSSPA
jgi:Cu(I)/Ag(I) efflux system membrane fusion protein